MKLEIDKKTEMRVNDWAQAPGPLPHGVEGRGGRAMREKNCRSGIEKNGGVVDQQDEEHGEVKGRRLED